MENISQKNKERQELFHTREDYAANINWCLFFVKPSSQVLKKTKLGCYTKGTVQKAKISGLVMVPCHTA